MMEPTPKFRFRTKDPTMTDTYIDRSYGLIDIGFGEKPGVVVIDFIEDWRGRNHS
jgi:hypothetical protein